MHFFKLRNPWFDYSLTLIKKRARAHTFDQILLLFGKEQYESTQIIKHALSLPLSDISGQPCGLHLKVYGPIIIPYVEKLKSTSCLGSESISSRTVLDILRVTYKINLLSDMADSRGHLSNRVTLNTQ